MALWLAKRYHQLWRHGRDYGYWVVLGDVYADTHDEAMRRACKRWGAVDSLYEV